MPPTPERIVRLFVRQALLLITLIIIVAFPCFSQRQTSFVKSASLPDSPCLGSQLSVRHEAEDAAMGGRRSVFYSFKNNSQSPCTLKGYPAYVLLDRAGRPIQPRRAAGKSAKDDPDEQAKAVTLAPGGKVFFSVDYSSCESTNGATGRHTRCTYSAKARITAPGTKRTFIIREVIDPEGRDIKGVSPVVVTLEELGIHIEKPKP